MQPGWLEFKSRSWQTVTLVMALIMLLSLLMIAGPGTAKLIPAV